MNEKLRIAEGYIDDAALAIIDGNMEIARRYMMTAKRLIGEVQGAPMSEMVETEDYFQAIARLC